MGGTTALSLTAAASWGAADFAGGLAARRASPYLVVTVAHGLSLAALLALAVLTRALFPTPSSIAYALAAGLAGGAGLVAFYRSLSLGQMGLSAALAGLVTAILPVAVSSVLDGLPKTPQLAGFAVAIAAIWLIAYKPTEPGSAAARSGAGALWLAVLAGTCFGLLLILLRLADRGSVLWTLTFSHITSTGVAAIPAAALFRRGRSTMAEDVAEQAAPVGRYLPLAATAGFFDTGGNLLYALAARVGRLDIAAVLSSLYPAGTILLAAWLLKERTTRSQAVGIALALAAVALISA